MRRMLLRFSQEKGKGTQMTKHLLAVLITTLFIQGLFFGVTPGAALAQEMQAASFVSGAVYLDANANGMAEPDELNIAGATVNVQATDGTTFTAVSSDYGFYIVNDLPLGTYQVWAVDSYGNATNQIAITLGEVNAAVALDLGIIDNSNDVEFTAIRQVFLPFVNN